MCVRERKERDSLPSFRERGGNSISPLSPLFFSLSSRAPHNGGKGEPLISKNFWKFVDSMGTAPNLKLAVNSNFSVDQNYIKKLAKLASNFSSVNIGASIDATGSMAEYARQGLDYSKFIDNIEYWCSETPANCSIYLQSTVNLLNVWGLTDKFDLNIQLRQRYPERIKNLYCTVVRNPEFQSIGILPEYIKLKLHTDIQNWTTKNSQYLTDIELIYINKIIGYLINSPNPMHNFTNQQLEIDFAKFLQYYNNSSRHKYQDVYPIEFIEWIQKIQTYETMHHSN